MIRWAALTASMMFLPQASRFRLFTQLKAIEVADLHAQFAPELHSRKRMGLSSERCGKPLLHSTALELTPSNLIVQEQSNTNNATQWHNESGKPFSFMSRMRIKVWTNGNAFATLSTIPMATFLFHH